MPGKAQHAPYGCPNKRVCNAAWKSYARWVVFNLFLLDDLARFSDEECLHQGVRMNQR